MKKNYLQFLFIMILAVFMLPNIGKSQITTFPWTEGFENGGTIPTGWTNDASDAGGDWSFVTSNSHGPSSDNSGSGYYALLNDYSITTSNSPFYLNTPTLDLSTAGKSYQISYWYWIGGDAASNPIIVEASSDGGTNWTTIFTHDHSSTAAWTQNTINISAYSTSTVVIRFKGVSNWGSGTDNSGIDDVTVEELPSCPAPTNQLVTGLTATGAQLNWTSGGATNFNVEYGPTGFTPGTGTMVAVATDTFKILTGLTAGASYDWYVQDSCGATDVSAWVGPNTFTTSVNSFPYTEDFENAGLIPNGWTNDATDAGGDWSFVTSNSHGPSSDNSGSGYYALLNDYSITTSNSPFYLITPTFDLSAAGKTYRLSYWVWIGSSSASNPIHIDISTDGGLTWTNDVFIHDQSITNTWFKNSIILSSYNTSNVVIRFKGVSNWGSGTDNSGIDDVTIDEVPNNEIAVSQILGNYGGFDVSSTDTVKVIVTNNGAVAQTSLPMNYTLDNGAVVSETMPTLAAFTTDTFTFATTFDASAVAVHTLTAYSSLANDEDNSNDTTSMSFTTNAVTTVPDTFDFPNTTDLNFQLVGEEQASVDITPDANNGNGNGIRLIGGSSSSGWGSNSTVTEAFDNTTHISKANMMIDATGIANSFIDFDLKMSYTYSSGYSWLRVMINDTIYAKTLNGDSVWQPMTKNADDWRNITLNLSDYAGTIYSLSFETAMKYASTSSSHDQAFLDNIKLYVPPTNDVGVTEITRNYGGFGDQTTDTVTVLVKNNGASAQTAIPINFKLDNGNIVTENMPTLAAFSTGTFTFATTFDASAGGVHTLTAYTSLSGDEDNSNDTMVKSFITYSAHSIPFTEDFESGYTYFENDAANTTNFALTSTLSHSGTQSVHDAYVESSDDILIEAGAMDLTSSTTPVLDFWQIAKTEGGYDKCYVEISMDNGGTWTALDDSLYLGESSNYAVKGYFHEDSYSDWGTGYETPDNSWWKMERFNLAPFKDDSIRVRFKLHSDGGLQKDGWYLDDITVQEEPAAVANLGNDTAICAGESIDLMANNNPVGYTYLWTVNGDTVANTTNMLNTDSAGTYTVEVTGINTVNYDSIVVSINALPTVAVSGDATICNGDSALTTANFTGSSPWNFTVNDGTNTFNDSSATALSQRYANPSDTTSYTVVSITDGNGCVQNTHSDTITINVNPLPVVAQSSLSDVCYGTSVFTLTGGSPANGYYSGVGVDSATSIFNSTIAGAGNQTITYTFTDANGCTNTASTIQKVDALPNITATAGANPVPYNTSTTLNAAVSNAVGVLSYSWTPTASIDGDSLLQTVNTINVVSATTYVVNVSDAATTCQNTDTVNLVYSGGPISVNPIAVPSSVCYGDTTQLKAQASGGNGTINYTWTSNPAGYNANTENPFASLTQDTWFIVIASDGANTAKDSVLVTVLANPTVSYTVDSTSVCIGNSTYAIANLTGSAPFSYTYNGIIVSGVANTIDSVMVNTTTDVMYRLTSVTDNNGCTSTGDLDSMKIHVNALPTIVASDNDTICNGDSATVTLNFTGASPWSYDVYDGSNTFTQNSSTTTTNVYPNPSTSTNYIVTSVTDNNGCVSTGNLDSVYIQVNDLPTVAASDNDTICFGDSAQITLNLTGAAPYSFTVNDGTAPFNDNSATNTFMTYADPDATTNYVLVNLTDANGCNISGNLDSVEIYVNALPAKPSFTGLNTDYCADAADATLTPNPIGGTFTGTGVSGNFFSPVTAGAGSYDVVYTVTDGNNCSNGDTMTTMVNALPVVQLSGLATDYCVDAADAQLSGTPTGGTFMGTGLTANDEFSPSTAGVGTYTIKYTYTDGNSCTNIDSASTTVNALPVITMPTLSPVCIDAASFALSGATPAGGDWSGTAVNNNNFSPATAGAGSFYLTYTFTDANSCTNLDSTTQVVNALPVLSVSGLAAEYCADDAVSTLVATPAGGTLFGPGISGSTFDPSAAGAGQFSLLYFYTDANGCFNSMNMATEVHALPVVDLGTDYTICASTNTTIDAGSFVSYLWNTGATTQTITADSTGLGIGSFDYSVLVTDVNNCTNTDSVEITYEAAPVSQLTDSADVCGEGESIFLDAGYTPGNYYVWENGVAWSSVTIDTSAIGGTMGYMNVTINSPAGCLTYDSAYVYFKEAAQVNLGNDTTICWTQNITFDAGAGYASYLWNTGATTQTLYVDSFAFSLGMNTYSVEVTNDVMCSATDSVELMIDPCTGILTPVLTTAEINVYPNPTKGQFQIDVNGIESNDYDLSVYNSIGSKVYGNKVNYNGQSTQSWKLDFSTYPKGIYYIRLSSEGQIKVKRIIIQ